LDLGQDTWDKTKTLLGTFQKPNENMMRTWEHIEDKKKNKFFLTWPIDKGTNYGKDLTQSFFISKDLVQFVYTKLGGQNKTKLSLNITRKNFTTLV
jgi:hypothetical protein